MNDINKLTLIYESLHAKPIHIWLDDERDPTDPIIQKNFGSTGDEVWIKTADECIEMLKSGRVSSISLDHDLGPEEAGTGYDVAVWIEEAAYNKGIPKLGMRVHSANPVGRKNMERALINAERFFNK
jgi:hypothetical protein